MKKILIVLFFMILGNLYSEYDPPIKFGEDYYMPRPKNIRIFLKLNTSSDQILDNNGNLKLDEFRKLIVKVKCDWELSETLNKKMPSHSSGLGQPGIYRQSALLHNGIDIGIIVDTNLIKKVYYDIDADNVKLLLDNIAETPVLTDDEAESITVSDIWSFSEFKESKNFGGDFDIEIPIFAVHDSIPTYRDVIVQNPKTDDEYLQLDNITENIGTYFKYYHIKVNEALISKYRGKSKDFCEKNPIFAGDLVGTFKFLDMLYVNGNPSHIASHIHFIEGKKEKDNTFAINPLLKKPDVHYNRAPLGWGELRPINWT